MVTLVDLSISKCFSHPLNPLNDYFLHFSRRKQGFNHCQVVCTKECELWGDRFEQNWWLSGLRVKLFLGYIQSQFFSQYNETKPKLYSCYYQLLFRHNFMQQRGTYPVCSFGQFFSPSFNARGIFQKISCLSISVNFNHLQGPLN